ncbi:hypothetical protein [Nocardia fusca]|uniref:Uncharacterized protein n=1 Tax=Nocardia fusca TaxID=941183 RepID=A0ABV3F0J2_9NOCA
MSSNPVPLHQREGVWEFRESPVYTRAEIGSGPDLLVDHGMPGIRYIHYPPSLGIEDRVTVAFGHRARGGGFRMEMSWRDAEEFALIFAAAVREGQIARGADLEPVPTVDVTTDDCHCRYCAVRRDA